jgi:uncharacterized membrane protein
MTSLATKEFREHILLRMHPLNRVLIGILVTFAIFLLLKDRHIDPRILVVLLWDAFAFTYIIIAWIIIYTGSANLIRKQARKQDGSRFFVFFFVLLCCFASMLSVIILIVYKESMKIPQLLYLPVVLVGMILSWFMVHTIYAFHYAHKYYDNDDDPDNDDGGLKFPDENQPDYIDFAYFSFVIGMTFQVSDVTITSRSLRRTVLIHAVLAFGLNTVVVALTINIIAGLIH